MEVGRASAVEMVAAAYDLTLSLDAWISRKVELFRAHMDDGFGVYGGIAQRLAPVTVRMHLAGAHSVNRLLVILGMGVGFFDRLPQGYTFASSTDVLGLELSKKLTAPFRDIIPADDHLGVTCTDEAGLSIFIAAPRRELGPPPTGIDRIARRVLPHFAAGLRLRRSLTGLEFDTPSAEALFDANGNCLHAQGLGEPKDARQVLHEAVKNLARGRTEAKKTATNDDSAQQALLAGRWSLIERFDSDGRRFIVAYRNPVGVLDPRRLSERERDVASRIAQGMSQKLVAAELGIRASTVARVVAAVTRKLSIKSARELPLLWKDASGTPVALGVSNLIVITRPEAGSSPLRLTASEQQVLDQIVQGRSNREIATLRGTSVRTVANQVAALFQKLDVDSRVELAASALTE